MNKFTSYLFTSYKQLNKNFKTKIMKTLKNVFAAILLGAFVFTVNVNAQSDSDEKKSSDIVDLAVSTDFLNTLVAAVKAGDLVETLKGDGPFTVFAPTNEAFAALPKGTLETLLKPENKDQLVQILTYHVVAGKVKSTDLKDGMTAQTLQGSNVTVHISGMGVKINQANVTSADIEASNGIVHVIDQVILPPMK